MLTFYIRNKKTMNTENIKSYLYSLKCNVGLPVAYVVMMMSVEMLQLNTQRWWDPVVSSAFNVLFYSAMAWILSALAASAGQRMYRVVHAVAHVVVGLYAVSSIFLYLFFHRHWDAFTMQFIHETNPKEAGEFVRAYILSWQMLAIAAGTVLFFLGEWWVCSHLRPTRLLPRSRWRGLALASVVLLSVSQVFFFSTDSDRNYELVARFYTPVKRNALWTLWQSVLQYGEYKAEFERCADTLSAYTEHPTCREHDADVVVIIGESFSRHMSNLYDGPYNTNPLLLKRLREGGLYLFRDVIASDNRTTANFKYFMSTASVCAPEDWCDKPLFPAILRRCGYRSVYCSNQFVANDNLGQWDASMGFILHPGIGPHLFDWTNQHTYPYDLELVSDYAKHRQKAEAAHRNLCIFHLYGQHVMAVSIPYNTSCQIKTSEVKFVIGTSPHLF